MRSRDRTANQEGAGVRRASSLITRILLPVALGLLLIVLSSCSGSASSGRQLVGEWEWATDTSPRLDVGDVFHDAGAVNYLDNQGQMGYLTIREDATWKGYWYTGAFDSDGAGVYETAVGSYSTKRTSSESLVTFEKDSSSWTYFFTVTGGRLEFTDSDGSAISFDRIEDPDALYHPEGYARHQAKLGAMRDTYSKHGPLVGWLAASTWNWTALCVVALGLLGYATVAAYRIGAPIRQHMFAAWLAALLVLPLALYVLVLVLKSGGMSLGGVLLGVITGAGALGLSLWVTGVSRSGQPERMVNFARRGWRVWLVLSVVIAALAVGIGLVR